MPLRRLTGIDTAFLAAERPGQPLHMMGVLLLDPSTVPGGYRFERFRDFIAERLPALPPLRRRLLEVPGGLARPLWVDAPNVDVDLHVRRAAVPRPGGPRELAAMAAEMLERPLDRSRPLWEMTLVEEVEGGRIALLAKLSHAMMDGLAGVKLMASLFSPTPEIPPPPRSEPAPPAPDVPGRLELLAGAVPWLLRQPLRVARAGAETVRLVARRARTAVATPATPSPEVVRSWLNSEVGRRRSVATASLPLAELRRVAEAREATVNDVFLACVSGALRRYVDARESLPAEPLVAGMPVAIRDDDDDDRANAVTSVNVSLAVDLEDPLERLRAIRNATRAKKRGRRGTAGEGIAAWADVPPPLVFSLMSQAYLDLHLAERMDPICNLVVSSVPGPSERLYLAGARLERIHPLGPIFSGLALNITAIGFGDSLDVGLVACRRRLPDLWDLADALPAALAELAEVALPRTAARAVPS